MMNNNLIYIKKSIRLRILILILFYSEILVAQEKITLEDAIELVLENNLQIKEAALGEDLSEESLKQAQLSRYPTLVNGNNLQFHNGRSIDPQTNDFVNNRITTTNLNLGSNFALFQGFQKRNQILQNKYALEADKSNTQKVKNDLTLNVLTMYLQVLANRDLLSAAKQQLTVSQQQMTREQHFFDVGNKTLADLSQAKAQLAAAEHNVTDAQNQVDLSFLNLSQLLERDPALTFEVEKPDIKEDELLRKDISYSAAYIYAVALKQFPDIKLAEYRSLTFSKGIDLAKGNLYPRVIIQGDLRAFSSNNNQDLGNKIPLFDQLNANFNQVFRIGLTIPIFDGLSARSAMRQAKIKYEKAKIGEQLVRNNLNKIINQAVLDVQAAENKYQATQTAYISSKDAFYVTEQRHRVGLVNTLEYNQAQINLNKAQFEVIKATYDLLFRRKTIDFYLGKCLLSKGCD